MPTILVPVLFAAFLLFGVLSCLKLGWIWGRRKLAELGDDGHAGAGVLEGSIFGLMGLLIAFTFTGAADRFDHRRDLITQHVNAIGTAWLRLDLLDESTRAKARGLFRQYVDTLLRITNASRDPAAVHNHLEHLSALQAGIWSTLVEAAKRDKSQPLAQLLLPAANEVFDLTESRRLSTRQHPPPAIYAMLGLLMLVSSLMAGFAMAKAKLQSRLHLIGFAVIMSLSVYLILDFEFPRLGLVNIDSFDQAMIELRDSMK